MKLFFFFECISTGQLKESGEGDWLLARNMTRLSRDSSVKMEQHHYQYHQKGRLSLDSRQKSTFHDLNATLQGWLSITICGSGLSYN